MNTNSKAVKKDDRPIVCGTDFSPTAAEAVDVAAAIARRLGVTLVLIHVEAFRGLAVTEPSLFEALISQSREGLARESARVRGTGTVVEDKLLSGPVFEELVNAAVEVSARTVIVGAIGHGLARRLLVGSVAERVAETSSLPTLVVRPGSNLSAWIRGERALKILVGYDFSPGSDAALRWVQELRAIARCEVTIAHVDWPLGEAQRFGYHGPLPLTENPGEIRNFIERDLGERIAMILPPEDVSLSLIPGWGRTDAHLVQIAKKENFDLIVVGTHRRHGLSRLRFGSVSRGILHHAPASIGTVAAAQEDRRKSRIPKIERVMVATDFSADGNEAARYACAILQRGGILKLVHVIDSPNPSPAKSKRKSGKPNPKWLGQLRALAPEAAEERFEIELQVIEGSDAAEAIAQEAERFDADAICLGSHGQSGMTKALMGSIAEGVMSRSQRPVLLVRAPK